MPGPIKFKMRGDWSKTDRFFARMTKGVPDSILRKYGARGVEALRSATPVDTGLTAASWYYEIVRDGDDLRLEFRNSNLADGWCPIAIILQYGHAARDGSWVQGRDYINPALQPLFDQMAEDAWKEVIS